MLYRAQKQMVLTAEEFLWHPAARERTELVRGHIHMMSPASATHGLVSATILRLLSTYVWQHKLGACFADSTGFALPNLVNTVRSPDASFVRADRLPPEGVGGGFVQLAPDLAVEVLSPNESATDLAEKLADYRVGGTQLVWVVDPSTRTVTMVFSHGATETIGVGDALTGSDAVPGFVCAVSELFQGLAPPVTT